jgi:hypothetical protein
MDRTRSRCGRSTRRPNVDPTPASLTWVIDTTPPTVTILSASPNPVLVEFGGSAPNLLLRWSADENGTYGVRVGGTDCTSGAEIAGGSYMAPGTVTTTIGPGSLVFGSNTIRVCVTDAVTNTGADTESVEKKAATNLVYDGQESVPEGGSLILGARLSSADTTACSPSGKIVDFTIDLDGNGVDAGDLTGSATTDATGQAWFTAPEATGRADGPYHVFADFDGTAACLPSSDSGDATVLSAAQAAAAGSGSYALSGNGEVSFAFNAKRKPGTGSFGRVLLENNGKWRLKGDVTAFAEVDPAAGCPGSNCTGTATGSGDLYIWNQSLNGGRGDWSLAAGSVAFALTFTDASKGGGMKSTDAFGILIAYELSAGQPPLPNSPPSVLQRGHISIRR